MKQLNVAVIGLGVMGQTHARIYTEMPNVNLVAVHDIHHTHAENKAKELQTVAIKDLKELLADENIHAVSICTADDQHHDVAVMACDYGKHILIEKPLADTIADARGIMDKVNDTGTRMMVGHTLRWDPRYYLAREAVQAGKIGDPIHLHARRNNSYPNGKRLQGRTSVAMFLGVHDLDAIEWITNDRIKEVFAVQVCKRLKEFDVADAIITTLRFESGAIGSYETSWVLPENHVELDAKLDITGTAGVLNIDILDQNIRVFEKGNKVIFPDTMYGVDLYGKQTGIMKEELHSFVNSLLEDKPFPISVEDAYRAVTIVQSIEESLKSGKPFK
jgi:predicted dehydrogenase